MILLNCRFNFGNGIQKAYSIDTTDTENVKVNGTDKFQRIPLKETYFEDFGLPFYKTKKNYLD